MCETKKLIDCRVCLRYDMEGSQKCFSLFEKYNRSLIADKIKLIANISIRQGDGLPSKICPDCLLQLETAIIFKQRCEASNKILLNIIQKPSQVCKVRFKNFIKKEDVLSNPINNDFHDYSDTESLLPETTENYESDIQESEVHDPEVPEVAETCIEIENQKPDVLKIEYKKSGDKVPCYQDPEQSEIETNLQEDTQSRSRHLTLICDDCGEIFKSKCKMSVHWKKVHLQSKLICPLCKRMFKSYKAFHVHKKKKTKSCLAATKVRIEGQGKSRLFHCKYCEYKTKSIKDMDAHLVTHTGDRRFRCVDCLKSFTQHSSLQTHRETHHNDYRVEGTCHYCGKYIKGRNKFYKHIRKHEPKHVQCEVCNKVLKSRAILETHMKRHSGVKSYTCETCSANFFTPSELCNHRRRVHFKVRNYKCDLCEYSTYTSTALKSHKSRHTQQNVVCLVCGMFVENSEKLEQHQKRHDQKNFFCTLCDKGFFLRESLRRHNVKKHRPPKKDDTDKVAPVNIKQEVLAETKHVDAIVISPSI